MKTSTKSPAATVLVFDRGTILVGGMTEELPGTLAKVTCSGKNASTFWRAPIDLDFTPQSCINVLTV